MPHFMTVSIPYINLLNLSLIIKCLFLRNTELLGTKSAQNKYTSTLYNTVCYNTVLDITRFKDGSQKCIDYIEK